MAPAPEGPFPLMAWAVWVAYMAGLVLFAFWNSLAWLLVLGFVVLQVYLRRTEARRWRQRAAVRGQEDIGTFARAFDRRGPEPFDPRVIRAVWDALAVEFTPGRARVPVRAEDSLDDDFGIEDVEPLATAVAERVGRSARAWQIRPSVLDDVTTVRGLVRLVSAQPSRALSPNVSSELAGDSWTRLRRQG